MRDDRRHGHRRSRHTHRRPRATRHTRAATLRALLGAGAALRGDWLIRDAAYTPVWSLTEAELMRLADDVPA